VRSLETKSRATLRASTVGLTLRLLP